MNVVSILNSHNFNILAKNKLGQGADGEVYALDSNRVIKYSILYDDYQCNLEEKYALIKGNLNFLIKKPNPLFCKVYDFEHLLDSFRVCNGFKQEFKIYSYVLDKMFALSEDERKVLYSILNFKGQSLTKMICELSYGLDFDENKVLNFSKLLSNNKYHNDIHIDNVMKDSFGNFKLVDFDRMEGIKDGA